MAYLGVWPLNWLLNQASRSILRLLGVAEAPHAEVLSGEEIKDLVATSKEHGEIHEAKADMLHNLFEFDQRLVGRVMIPRGSVHALDVSANPDETLEAIRQTVHSRFPVVDGADGDAIVGVLLAKDLYAALLAGEVEPWTDLRRYARPPLVVPESQKVSRLFEQMRGNRAHMAFVVDEYGAFVGVVTLEDLIEEIVGEIQDETDVEGPAAIVRPVEEGRWEADGLVSLGDLERSVGLRVPVDLDVNTLSGLCMQRLGRMPQVGDEVTESGYRIRVCTLEDRRVGLVSIERERLGEPVEEGEGVETSSDGAP